MTVASRGFNLSNSCKINVKIPRLILDMMYFTSKRERGVESVISQFLFQYFEQ